MASTVPGYEYDIFISYRQKDNKGDRWVSEFVDALKTELESTFKEDISVYFDINPHDGLLETHDVNASLKEKLRCLVFIPIISRTYCDPQSFAWEHEFKPFVEQASQDKFGLKVKLPNGNVANRVLPVRIHDLDNEDIKLYESVLGGVLRGVEFIYKEPGVDKPLAPEDNERKNLNNSKYRIQIIKVAHAIKEIILGLKEEPVLPMKDTIQLADSLKKVDVVDRKSGQLNSSKFSKRKMLSRVAITTILIIAAVLAYPKIFKQDKLANLRSSDGRISIAVMPFQNMTNDTIWNVWQDGIQNNLITSLSNSEELKVRQAESIKNLIQNKGLTNYSSITPSVASTLSQKLEANIFIYGSINQAASIVRLNAQVVDSKTQEALKSFQIDGATKNILTLIDSLSILVRNYLIISKLEKETSQANKYYAFTNSPDAYRYFMYGQKAFEQNDFSRARDWYNQAISIDSNFVNAILYLSTACAMLDDIKEAKKWCLKAYAKRDQMSIQNKLSTNAVYSNLFETPYEEIKWWKQLLEIDDQVPINIWNLARCYNQVHEYDKAIPELERVLGIYKKWGSKPMWIWNYYELGIAYHKTGQYKKEKELYKIAEQDFPDDPDLISSQAILSLSEGDTILGNRYIKKFISIRRENKANEAEIDIGLAFIYLEANIPAKAEEYLRQALVLEPETPVRMNGLAYFLIDKDRNINEGLELNDKALKISPDNYRYLHTKGWGLYKQGKYKEALKLLEKADSLKPTYHHVLYLHLEEAKKAVASQK